jgi:hypothetical protein
MAFVNEWISEEDRAKHKIDSLSGVHIQWTADRERGIYLLNAGCIGGPEIELSAHYEFLLLLDEFTFRILGKSSYKIDSGKRYLHWELYQVVPRLDLGMGGSEDELKQIITEGFQELVFCYDKSDADVVTVSFEVQ